MLLLSSECAWGSLYDNAWGRLYNMLLLYHDECVWGKQGHGQNWRDAEQQLDST